MTIPVKGDSEWNLTLAHSLLTGRGWIQSWRTNNVTVKYEGYVDGAAFPKLPTREELLIAAALAHGGGLEAIESAMVMLGEYFLRAMKEQK